MTLNLILVLVTLNVLVLLGIGFVVFLIQSSKRGGDHEELFSKINQSLKFSLEPMSEIPLGVEEIVELATEVWKIEQRISKASENMAEIHQKALSNSINRLKNYLNKYDVEIQEYTGQKYNDGLNFDILSREQDPTLEFAVIKETVEPTIICRGRVVKRAKVILASNQI